MRSTQKMTQKCFEGFLPLFRNIHWQKELHSTSYYCFKIRIFVVWNDFLSDTTSLPLSESWVASSRSIQLKNSIQQHKQCRMNESFFRLHGTTAAQLHQDMRNMERGYICLQNILANECVHWEAKSAEDQKEMHFTR